MLERFTCRKCRKRISRATTLFLSLSLTLTITFNQLHRIVAITFNWVNCTDITHACIMRPIAQVMRPSLMLTDQRKLNKWRADTFNQHMCRISFGRPWCSYRWMICLCHNSTYTGSLSSTYCNRRKAITPASLRKRLNVGETRLSRYSIIGGASEGWRVCYARMVAIIYSKTHWHHPEV